MTAFLDRAGRQCVLSWLREEALAENLLGRAGAHSIASVLTLDAAGQLVMHPHPDVEALRGPALTANRDRWQLGDVAAEVCLPAKDMTCEVAESDGVRAALRIDAARGVVSIDCSSFGTKELPLDGGDVVTVIVDADILEVFKLALHAPIACCPRISPAATTIVVDGAGDDDVVIRPLRVG